jgi:hypothetical protein
VANKWLNSLRACCCLMMVVVVVMMMMIGGKGNLILTWTPDHVGGLVLSTFTRSDYVIDEGWKGMQKSPISLKPGAICIGPDSQCIGLLMF